MFDDRKIFSDALLFYTGVNMGNICKRNVIFLSPSPDQYISSSIEQLLNDIDINTAFIYDENDNTMTYNSIIIDAIMNIESESGDDHELIVDIAEYNSSNPLSGIEYFIISAINGKKKSYLITTLQGDNLLYLFEYYYQMTKYMEQSKIIPIYTFSSSFLKINRTYTIGHYFFSHTIPYYPTSQALLENVNSILGYDYIYTGTEFNYILAFSLISKSIESTKEMSYKIIMQYLYNNELQTEIGQVQLTIDNVISHPIISLTIDKNGILQPVKYVSMLVREARVWNTLYLQQTIYSCNWKISSSEKYPRSTLKIDRKSVV